MYSRASLAYDALASAMDLSPRLRLPKAGPTVAERCAEPDGQGGRSAQQGR
jgi:hypothetical protein